MRRATWADLLLLLLLAFIWGASFTLIKVVVPHLPPFSLTLWRVAMASLILLAAALLQKERLRFSAAGWGWIVLAGLTGNTLPFTLISWGEQHIDSGLAAILISISPFLVLLLAHFFTPDERLTWRRLAGMILGFTGVLIVVGPSALGHVGDDVWRQLAVAAAAACYAANTLIVRHLQLHHMKAGSGPLALAAAIMLASVPTLLPEVFWLEGVVLPPARAALWAVTLGVVNTALATLIMFAIIRRAGTTFFANVNFFTPVFGYLLGVLALGESFSWRAVAALMFVLAGIFVAFGIPRRDRPG